jgi:hypothetical protein
MGEPVNVVRMTISVPRDVKTQMDAVREKVNWSALATQAFRDELKALESRKEVSTMDEVIARLKTAAELEANEDYQAGLEAGRGWAKSTAKPKELRRAADYVERAANLAPDYFVFAVWPQRKDDGDAPGEFWEEALGNDKDRAGDSDFLHGFGDGAAEIWDKVANQL